MNNHLIWEKFFDVTAQVAPELQFKPLFVPKDLIATVDNLPIENNFFVSYAFMKRGYLPVPKDGDYTAANVLDLIESRHIALELKKELLRHIYEVLKEALLKAKEIHARQIPSEVNMIWLGAPCPEKYLDNLLLHAKLQPTSKHILWCDPPTLDYIHSLPHDSQAHALYHNWEAVDWHLAFDSSFRQLPQLVLEHQSLLEHNIDWLKKEDPAYASNILRLIIMMGEDPRQHYPAKVYYDVDNKPSLDSVAYELLKHKHRSEKQLLVNSLDVNAPALNDNASYYKIFGITECCDTGLKFQPGSLAMVSGSSPSIFNDLLLHQIKGLKVLMQWRDQVNSSCTARELIEDHRFNYESFRSVHSASNAIPIITAGKKDFYLQTMKKMSAQLAARHKFDNTHKPDKLFVLLLKENINIIDVFQNNGLLNNHDVLMILNACVSSHEEPKSYFDKKEINDRLQWLNASLSLYLLIAENRTPLNTVVAFIENSPARTQEILKDVLKILQQRKTTYSPEPYMEQEDEIIHVSELWSGLENDYIDKTLFSLGYEYEEREQLKDSPTRYGESLEEDVPKNHQPSEASATVSTIRSCCDSLVRLFSCWTSKERQNNQKKND